MNNEPQLITSSLSQRYTQENKTVSVDIYSTGKNDWSLEIVDESGNSQVYDEVFKTDQLAIDQFMNDVMAEGINSFITED